MRTLLSLIPLISLGTVFAQSPQAINYQAVCKSTNGNAITNSTIGVEIDIIETSTTGPVIYTESHSVTTNNNGIFTVQIGQGTTSFGQFDTIPWSGGTYFMEISIDTLGGTNYTSMGISQFLSVPYALFANSAPPNVVEVDDSDFTSVSDTAYIGAAPGYTYYITFSDPTITLDLFGGDYSTTMSVNGVYTNSTEYTFSNWNLIVNGVFNVFTEIPLGSASNGDLITTEIILHKSYKGLIRISHSWTATGL
jgi:hypothetical protein